MAITAVSALSGAALATEVKVVGPLSAGNYEMKQRFHVVQPAALALAPTPHLRAGTWALTVVGLDGDDLHMPLELAHLKACGDNLAIFVQDGVKASLSNGSLEQGQLTMYLHVGTHDLTTAFTKSGFGKFSGKVVDADSGTAYSGSLTYAGPTADFAISDVVVSLNGTPVQTPATEGPGKVFYHKVPEERAIHGIKFAHAGVADASVCYQVTTPDAGSVIAYSPETSPSIAMIYQGEQRAGQVLTMFVLGFGDRPHVQPKPRVVSAYSNSADMAIGVDFFPAPDAADACDGCLLEQGL